MNEVDLMPCPFCGGEAEFIHKRTTHDIKLGYIKCVECGARMEQENCTEDFARYKWNTRKPMDEGIEKLKEEMVFYEQIKKETEEKDYRYLYHKIAEAYGKAVVIMHKSKWQERGADDELHN